HEAAALRRTRCGIRLAKPLELRPERARIGRAAVELREVLAARLLLLALSPSDAGAGDGDVRAGRLGQAKGVVERNGLNGVAGRGDLGAGDYGERTQREQRREGRNGAAAPRGTEDEVVIRHRGAPKYRGGAGAISWRPARRPAVRTRWRRAPRRLPAASTSRSRQWCCRHPCDA